jgi:hypothetical protein
VCRDAQTMDNSLSIVTATISSTNARAELASHNLERLKPKPTSATISHAAAANSAISVSPFNVTIALTRGAALLAEGALPAL